MEMYSLDWYKEQFAEFFNLISEEDDDYNSEDVETAVIMFPAYLMGKFNLRLDSIFDNGYIEILQQDNYILKAIKQAKGE